MRRPRTTVPTALIWILIWVVLPTEKARSVMATDNWQRTCGALAFSTLSESPAKAPAAIRSFDWLLMCKFTSPLTKTLLTLSLGTSTNPEERACKHTDLHLFTYIDNTCMANTRLGKKKKKRKKPTMLQERDGKQWNVWGINDLTGNTQGHMLPVINWGCMHKGQQEQTWSRH